MEAGGAGLRKAAGAHDERAYKVYAPRLMYWPRATCRRRERVLLIAVIACLLGCGENILVARELGELESDAGAAPLLDAGSRRKQAINAERARARLRSIDDDKHGDDSKRP